MPRDINIRPDIQGLDEAFQNELQAAKTQPGTLESVLGFAALPLKLAKAKKAEAKKKALGQFARTGQLPDDFQPDDAQEVSALANAKQASRLREDESLPLEMSRHLYLKYGDKSVPMPPNGYTARQADILIAAKNAESRGVAAGRGSSGTRAANPRLAKHVELALGLPEGSLINNDDMKLAIQQYRAQDPQGYQAAIRLFGGADGATNPPGIPSAPGQAPKKDSLGLGL